MDSKEVKNKLKQARECIRNKEYKEALKQCKAVLAEYKDNYNALVFVGVSAEGLEEIDKAIKAYKRAIEVSPDQVLAWQGLGGLYEKHHITAYDEDLINVYKKLSELFSSDPSKLYDTKMKLVATYVRSGKLVEALDTVSEVMKMPVFTVQSSEEVQRQLSAIGEKSPVLSEEDQTKFLWCMDTLLKGGDRDLTTLQDAVPTYIKLILKQNQNLEEVRAVCTGLMKQFPRLADPVETLLIIDMDSAIGDTWPVVDPVFIERVGTLTDIDSDSGVLNLARGFLDFIARNCITARDHLSKGCEAVPGIVCAHFFMTWTLFCLHCNNEAVSRGQMCLNLLQEKRRRLTVKPTVVVERMNLLLAKVHLEIGNKQSLDSSTELLSKVKDQSKVAVLEGFIKLKQGHIEKAEEILQNATESLEQSALKGWILYHKKQYKEAIDILSRINEDDPQNSMYGVMYCKALWELWKLHKDAAVAQKCFTTLLKTAKQDPYHSEVFELLGYFYRDVQKDRVRSRKCLEKSFELDQSNEMSGAALCDMLSDDGKEEEAYNLLKKVTETASAGSAKWAWVRYGLHQMKHESLSSAVASLQSAVRADPGDSHVWECLAEAYLHRGSYTAALKAFTKVIELNPESLYSLYKIASIKQKLGTFKEAIEEYKVILEKSHNFVPALKGIGETYLLLAQHQLTAFHDGRAKDSCQEALVYLTRAASHRPDLSCLWKMMGDALTMCHSMCQTDFQLLVPEKLLGKTGSEETRSETCSVILLQSLQLGSRCFGKALNLLPDCASLWHDLGMNLFHQSQLCLQQEQLSLAERSVNCLKQAITLDAGNYRHWNGLGVIVCYKDFPIYNPKLAQHCFIKSVQVEQNNVVAWTNIATLYLQSGNIQLAHEAYKVAQSLDPSYVACWIGQAIIAETVGDQDAMDLFRHTTELGVHVEGNLGYAHWVCSMLQDRSKHNTELYQYAVHHMKAIPSATDAVAHYIDRVKTNATAYNLYGLLLEQQGLLRSAAEAWRNCLTLMERGSKDTTDSQVQQVKVNLARVLSKLRQFPEAIALYESCDRDVLGVVDICYRGLTYHSARDTHKACQEFEEALQILEDEGEKSQILAALAMVNYRSGGTDSVKSYLFQGSQLSTPSTHGLLALCSLGVLYKDVSLTRAVIEELLKLNNVQVKSDIAKLFMLYYYAVENSPQSGVKYIEQCLHHHPDSGSLWHLLSVSLLHYSHSESPLCVSVAQTAEEYQPQLKSVLLTLALAQISDGYHSNDQVKMKEAVKCVQRLCHLYPGDIEHWCALAAAVKMLSCHLNDNMLQWRGCFYLQWLSMEDSRTSTELTKWINNHLTQMKQLVSGH